MFPLLVLALALTPTAARQQSLFTSSVTYCSPPDSLFIQHLDVAYFPANTSVLFNVSVASVQPNVNVSANLFFNVYGLSAFNATLNLCSILRGALCPLPIENFTAADSIPLPPSFGIADKIPSIAYSIPDLEGFAQLTLRDVKTGAVRACVQATLTNGWSAHQAPVEWSLGAVTLAALLAALVSSLVFPSAIAPFRFVELIHLYQSIATSAFLDLNYPSVYRSFTLNFSWILGLFNSDESSLQASINNVRHKTGGRLPDANVGSAVGFVNRKLSPFNNPNNLAASSPDTILTPFMDIYERQTTNGQVQTVTADSSNVLQAGIPIYVNTLFITTANAFMTVFLIALCLLAIFLATSILAYGVTFLLKRRRNPKASLSRASFHLPSLFVAWFLRLVLIVFFPLLLFIFYQWTLKDSWLPILLSVITFLALSTVILVTGFRIVSFARRESPPSLYDHGARQFKRNSPLFAQYRAERFWFSIVMIFAIVFRSVLIAFAKSSGEAQIALLLVLEFGLVAASFALHPTATKGAHVLSTYIAITRLVCTGLMIAFLQKLRVLPIPRVAIGMVLIAAWSISVVVLAACLFWDAFKKGVYVLSSRNNTLALEKGIRDGADHGTQSKLIEETRAPSEKGSDAINNIGSEPDHTDLNAVPRGTLQHRPMNPTPEQATPISPYFLEPFPISPTGTVTTMDPPSLYSRDSESIQVGNLLPRRWSITMSQPVSPMDSTHGGNSGPTSRVQSQRNSLTFSVPPSTPSENSHPALSRSASLIQKVQQQYVRRQEGIEEEASETISQARYSGLHAPSDAAPSSRP